MSYEITSPEIIGLQHMNKIKMRDLCFKVTQEAFQSHKKMWKGKKSMILFLITKKNICEKHKIQ